MRRERRGATSAVRVPDRRPLLGAVGTQFSCDLLRGGQNATQNYPPELPDHSTYRLAQPSSASAKLRGP